MLGRPSGSQPQTRKKARRKKRRMATESLDRQQTCARERRKHDRNLRKKDLIEGRERKGGVEGPERLNYRGKNRKKVMSDE